MLRNYPTNLPLAVLVGTQPWPTIVAIPGPITTHLTPPRNLKDLFTPPPSPITPPLGWLTAFSYNIGALLEPRASSQNPNKTRPPSTSAWPLAVWVPLLAAWTYNPQTGTWHQAGNTNLLPPLPNDNQLDTPPGMQSYPPYTVGTLVSTTGKPAFTSAVANAVEQIRSGVVFQANLAHQLTADFQGCPRAFFRDLLLQSLPDCGCYLELPQPNHPNPAALLSLSPELFLTYDHTTRRVQTRPMKGTRRTNPADPTSAQQAHINLEHSPKDRAELAMIIDLMRNDLGRVCDTGSINVTQPRTIEHHAAGQLLQAVGVVEGTLRTDQSLQSLLAAAFPPGSVTGAPKIRAMQLIDELEPTPESPSRGPWCGAIGHIQNNGNAAFNVAIRTATITTNHHNQQKLIYPVGAGIVADSDPQEEWNETIAKASILLNTLHQPPESIQ